MDTNPPPDPTQGALNHHGPDQDRKPGQIQPKIDEKSEKLVFPAKSAKLEEGGNVLDQSDAPSPNNDRDDGNMTNPKQQGPPSAPERGMATPSSSSTTATSTSTAGTSSSGTRPKTSGKATNPTKSNKAKKGNKKKTHSVIEDTTIDSNSEYSSTSEKEDSTNQARFGKLNKVIKELIKIPNSNLQGQPEVQAPLQHNWGKERETKPCAIDMYEKETAARDLLVKLNTPSNKRPPESPTGATPEAKAAVHPSPGGTTQVRAETPLRSTVSTGNFAQMPKLTPQKGATSSPGGSGVSKEVGGGTGRGEHDSLPKRAPPSGEHTDTTQQRDGGHPKEVATKADVNPLANLKGKAADRLRSSNLSQAVPAASYKVYDEFDRNVAGEEWQVVQHKRQTRPIEPKQLPPKPGRGRQAFWSRHNEEHHRDGALGCGVKGCRWETNVKRQGGGSKRTTTKPYDRPQQPSSAPGGTSTSAPRSASSFKRPAQTTGARTKPTTPQSSSRKPQQGTSGSTPSHQGEDSEMPDVSTPGPSQATGGPSTSAPRSYSQAAGASGPVTESVSLYVHKGTTQKEPLTEQEFNTGWKLVTDSALHLMLNKKLGSNFEILTMSFEADRGHIKCNNRETATKVREILAECNRVSAIKMKAWFPWESATSLVTVVRRDTVLTDLPYIIKMWKLLNQLPDKGWHRPQLKIADRVAIITFGAEGELLTRLEEMVQQKSKLRTAYSYDAIRIAKRDSSQSSTPTGSSRKEQPETTQEAQPPHEEEHMEDDIDAEAERQPDTDQGSEADREIDAFLEAQPHMEDLGSDMEQEGRQPLNWAEEAEREERLRENPQAGQHHHS